MKRKKNNITVNAVYETKTREEVSIILTEEIAKLYNQGRFDDLIEEVMNKKLRKI